MSASDPMMLLKNHHAGSICAVCITRNTLPKVVTAGADLFVKIADLSTGIVERSIPTGHTLRIKSMILTYCGTITSRIYTSGLDGSIRAFEFRTGSLLFILKGHSGAVGDFNLISWDEFSFLASGGYDFSLRVWDLDLPQDDTGRTVIEDDVIASSCVCVERIHEDWINAVATFRHGGDSYIVTGSSDWTIIIWVLTLIMKTGTATLTLKKRLSGHSGAVLKIITVPSNSPALDGIIIISAGVDRAIRAWCPVQGTALWTLEGHESFVRSVCFIPRFAGYSSGVLVSTGEDMTIRIWQLGSHRKAKPKPLTETGTTSASSQNKDKPTKKESSLELWCWKGHHQCPIRALALSGVVDSDAHNHSFDIPAGNSDLHDINRGGGRESSLRTPSTGPGTPSHQDPGCLRLVAVDWEGVVGIYNLSSVEKELCWRRRRSFVMFISRWNNEDKAMFLLPLTGGPQSSTSTTATVEDCPPAVRRSMLHLNQLLECKAVCRIISSFL